MYPKSRSRTSWAHLTEMLFTLANRVKPPELPGLRGSRYRANKTPVESGFFLFTIYKVYKCSLSTDRSDVLWHADTLQPQDINDKAHHILTDICGIEYFQRIVNIRGNLVRSVSLIRSFTFTTQPGPTPSIGHSVPHSHELRAQHRRENRHDWNQNQILFNLYVHRKCSWLVQKSKSAMIGFLYPQSLN